MSYSDSSPLYFIFAMILGVAKIKPSFPSRDSLCQLTIRNDPDTMFIGEVKISGQQCKNLAV